MVHAVLQEFLCFQLVRNIDERALGKIPGQSSTRRDLKEKIFYSLFHTSSRNTPSITTSREFMTTILNKHMQYPGMEICPKFLSIIETT